MIGKAFSEFPDVEFKTTSLSFPSAFNRTRRHVVAPSVAVGAARGLT